MKKTSLIAICTGVSVLALAAPAAAQDSTAASTTNAENFDEIVVSARRREETKQDVPLTVQAVTSEDLSKLNIREFKEVQSLVPGLTLSQEANGIASQATLRGVAFNVNASGNNGTIEFYLNDAPLSASILFQSMFDVGQIEVLRGPQGTLRGRASPSGSITVTTRKPDLSEVGATANATLNDESEYNLQGAINVPIIADRLAVRFAGVYDLGKDNRVRSINNSLRPRRETMGGRISVRFDPFDNLQLNASYNVTDRDARVFDQVESAKIADPNLPASPVFIQAGDRAAVERVARTYHQTFKVYNWSAEYSAFGQKLNYVGSHNTQAYDSMEPNDKGAALPLSLPSDYINSGQITVVRAKQTNHEIRLSSQERIAGIFDYVVGYLHNTLDNPTHVEVQTPVYFAATGLPRVLSISQVQRLGSTKEDSFFGNITAHIGEGTEVSFGARRIKYHVEGDLIINGNAQNAAHENRSSKATIFSASLKQQITPDLMAYANFGSSWRPGSSTNSVATRGQPAIMGDVATYLYPQPEKSKSYEIGIKSQWFDRRVTLNIDYFHQDFTNFGYVANSIFYITEANGLPGVGTATTFTTGVPAKVNGVEGELGWKITPNWNFYATAAYALGKVGNGVVACNPYEGVPTAEVISDKTKGQQMAFCSVSGIRTGNSSPFVATAQSEYTLPVSASAGAYLRGLVSFYGKSQGDPSNPLDSVSSYAIANFFAGVRDTDGGWEIGAYVKNAFDTERVLTRGATVLPSGASVVGGVANSTYRGITMTAPREFGLTARFALGSR